MRAVDETPRMRVEVLGPLRLVVDGVAVEVPGPKRRAVLALLALAEGRTVPVDRLVDALWPTEMPDSARQALHTHVSRLRGHLGGAAARLQTRQEGYRLDLDPVDLDVTQARALLATARTRAQRDPAGALPLLREANGLWRGPVLADLTDVEAIATAVEGCAQLHRDVTDALIGCAVDAGEAATVAGLAGDTHAADPLREPAVLLLMRTLAATGRAPEALRTGRTYRTRLAEETGLDPSPALAALERDVAAGAASAVPVAPAGPVRPTTRLIGREARGRNAAPAARGGAVGHARRAGRRGQDPGRPGRRPFRRGVQGAAARPRHRPRRDTPRAGGGPEPQRRAGRRPDRLPRRARRRARAPGRRQLRAPPRRGPRHRRHGPGRVPPGGRADHEPRTARAGRRARVPAGPAPVARRRRRGRPRARRLGRGLPRPRRAGAAGAPGDAGRAPDRRRHRQTARRHAAGHRAGRAPAVHVLPRRPAGAAAPRARPARRRAGQHRHPAPDAASDRRVVLSAPVLRPATAVPAPVGVRRRRRPGRGRAGRIGPVPATTTPASRSRDSWTHR